jgi:DNA-binding response OmpR family regulator
VARGWLAVYEQRQALLAFDDDPDPRYVDAIAAGVAYWSDRATKLSGLELDADRRLLNPDSDRQVLLTRREVQLLQFLSQRPGRYFVDQTLALRAWGDRLSGDQVRIYVRRLRAKLDGSDWQLVSRRGLGYALERKPAD